MNSVNMTGRLGADPELRYTQNGTAVANARIALSDVYTDDRGNRQERVTWVRVTVWGQQAQNFAQYAARGHLIGIEGDLQNNTFTFRDVLNDNGEPRQIQTLEVRVRRFHLHTTKAEAEAMAARQQNSSSDNGQQELPLEAEKVLEAVASS